MAVPLEQEVAVRCCSGFMKDLKTAILILPTLPDMSDGKTVLHSKEVLNL
jgi:hypothetical protein